MQRADRGPVGGTSGGQPRRRWLAEVYYVAVCLTSAVVLTWPLARGFTTRIAGGLGDPHQTLWSMSWMHDALLSFQNPFFTTRLYHPQGATLVFFTFDLPSALLVLPLWGLLPEVAIYNTAVLLAFALTTYGMFRFAREVTADTLCALLSGILFAAVPYHFAHLQGHLHLISMGWIPLYLVHLLRIVSGQARRRDAVLGGLFLALASLASWYHLLFAAVITGPLVGYGGLRHREVAFLGRFLPQVLILVGTWLVIAGPLFVAMVVAKHREDIVGAHDALVFSADAYSFVNPSAIQTWCLEGVRLNAWAGSVGEHATYVGFTVLLLALLGASFDRLSRVFVGIALLGGILSMGPYLQWNGRITSLRMPFWYLEHLVPALQFSGVPVRFGYVMYLGLITAAAPGLARLRRFVGVAPLSAALAVGVAVLALYEYRPCTPTTSQSPVPAVLRTWASDRGDWAVLDVSGGWRQMWHATIHRKPIVGGYLGRAPKRLEDWLLQQPIIRAITWPDAQLPLSRVDPQIDLAWGSRPDDGALVGDRFTVEWTGTLLAPADGFYKFWLSTTSGALLQIGTRRVAGKMAVYSGAKSLHEEAGEIFLRAGAHPLLLTAMETDRDAQVHLSWAPPGGERHVVPTQVLRAADGRPGLDAQYIQHIPPLSGLGRTRGREALRRLAIRYVITADEDNACVQRELELPEVYRGEDVRVYEVPDVNV